ncbi:MAG: glutathione peroxidase [Porphyromonadaceae bacterium CG2_30_38_12]|nr:MAG: glutathione peroxidase [Porphyromonadaceae bacterium CG2_30_38_12]
MTANFYDYTAKSLRGEDVSMNSYKNKVVIVVNVASKCGFTPQYTALESLYDKYKDKGLVILGFPCNQFGNQEPGSEEDIAKGCVLNYGVKFPMFAKVDVNGSSAHPLFKYLRNKLKGTLVSNVKWNFTKFLIDRNGNPVKRFAPITNPENMIEDIEKLL